MGASSRRRKQRDDSDNDDNGDARDAATESSEDEYANATQQLHNKHKRQRKEQKDVRMAEAGEDEEDEEQQEASGQDDNDDDEEEEEEPQTLEDKRALRRSYRELQQSMDDHKGEWVKQHSTGLLDALKQANSLFDQVATTQEAYLDSRLLTAAAKLSVVKVNNMKLAGRALDTADFLRRVRRRLNNSNNDADGEEPDLDWTRLAHAVTTGFRTPTIAFMYGPLAVEQKARKEIKRNVARINKDATLLQKPQQLQESDIQKQENETSKSVQKIMKVLQKKGPTNFFEFVINPGSFSQSVENIFYVSFLVRDGHVSIEIENGQPILCIVKNNEGDDDDEGGGGGAMAKKQQKQHIIELSHDTWKDIIETYNITETAIPTRPKSAESAGPGGKDKWYG
ncbi:UNVERIFIED_CONTAM: nuclear protein [Siphonaria sp. JEL0065]|nr:nuclear protein [Siphonaria sp. JEL0065]